MISRKCPSGLAPFDASKFRALAASHHASFVSADPFPHVVLDDFLPEPADSALKRYTPLGDRIVSAPLRRL